MAKVTIQALIKLLEQALEDAPHEARQYPVVVNTTYGPIEVSRVEVDVTSETVWLDNSGGEK